VAALEYLTRKGDDPLVNTFVLDWNASPGYRCVMRDQSLCLTKSRSSGYWLTNRGRSMTKDEMLRLQGMEGTFKQVVPSVLGAMLGNAMSQNVVERLLIRLLPAAGLIPSGGEAKLEDRWAKRTLSATPSKSEEWVQGNKAYRRKLKDALRKQGNSVLNQAAEKKGNKKRKAVVQ